MSYKPKFCCQCGEKIERIDWKPWTNRRFCELCETEFGIYDWAARGVIFFSLIIGFIGIGNYFYKSDKTLIVAANQANSTSAQLNKNAVKQLAAAENGANRNERNQPALQSDNSAQKIQQLTAAQPQKQSAQTNESAVADVRETVYYCGAQTKRGTPCSRRVKGGGRCWQHIGQPAMLPQAKLIVSQ